MPLYMSHGPVHSTAFEQLPKSTYVWAALIPISVSQMPSQKTAQQAVKEVVWRRKAAKGWKK